MKIGRICLYSLGLMLLVLSAAFAQNNVIVPPLNNIIASGNRCEGITVNRVLVNDTLKRFDYTLIVSPDATFNGQKVTSVNAVVVYPNSGIPNPGPNFIDLPFFPYWNSNGFDPIDNGIAFYSSSVSSNLLPGQSRLIGQAFYSTNPLPNSETIAVGVLVGESQLTQYCVTNVYPPIVPEPGTLVLMGIGLVSMTKSIRKRHK